jgi:prepilin-type N-terminal cleavage/methylation domain-containing protein/prepilin-type processing-associated H-X9-DG protein
VGFNPAKAINMSDAPMVLPKRHGFTLVELLTVLIIVVGIGVVLAPALAHGHRAAERQLCQSHLRQLAAAFSLYVEDSGGILPWSWSAFTHDIPIGTTNAGFQLDSYYITGTGLPYSDASGLPALGCNAFGIWYYPYVQNAAPFTCPTQLNIQLQNGVTNPAAFHLDSPAPVLIYNHYRQNPYFGHLGYGPGNNVEGFPGEITPWTSSYRVDVTIDDVQRPHRTILNFDVSPYRWETPYVCSPACAILAPSSRYLGGDRTLTSSYEVASFTPNIGFIHGAPKHLRGNFSFIDGHVQSMGTAMLADTNDTLFTLLK